MTTVRCLDLALASVLVVLTAPLLALLALCIRVREGRPVLHREIRLGRFGRPFTLIKLRTLRAGCEDDCSIAVEGDPRITGIGRWLRRSRCDELPQLLLVLRGQMSLVGPRPLKPEHAQCLPPELREALWAARPGLTGPSAIAFLADDAVLGERLGALDRPDIEALYLRRVLPAKARLDAAYLAHRTIWSDLRCLLRTLAALFSPSSRRASRALVEAPLRDAPERRDAG